MKKVVAVVTDEGGRTCHAAIVSLNPDSLPGVARRLTRESPADSASASAPVPASDLAEVGA